MEVWRSRRSPIYSTKGICTSSQPLASAAGIKILNAGGSAADAAVAMAAALNVVEPCSTGIGGDAFALYYDAKTKSVSCLMGNGSSSQNISLSMLNERGYGIGDNYKPLPKFSGLCVTVPGAALLWEDLIKLHGKLSLSEALKPAVELAEHGAPIGPVASVQWSTSFIQGYEATKVLTIPDTIASNLATTVSAISNSMSHLTSVVDRHTPRPGEIFFNKDLGSTFRTIGQLGAKEGFYSGRIANAIVDAVKKFDGVLDLNDLEAHQTEVVQPLSIQYKGFQIFETPPPTHGLAALIALKIFEQVDRMNFADTEINDVSTEHSNKRQKVDNHRGSELQAHLALECMRLGYSDALQYVCDPNYSNSTVTAEHLLSDEYIVSRAKLISLQNTVEVTHGDPEPYAEDDTVYFCCADSEGNACSMINSNYMHFGTGIIPEGCGFTLQNRGHNVSLQPGHPNVVAPRKKPYHTIIPGLITRAADQTFVSTFGNMGGFMQPMGHVQAVRNLIDFGLNPQEAVDAPRWYLDGTGDTQSSNDLKYSRVSLEYGYGGEMDGGEIGDFGTNVAAALRNRGHAVNEIVKGDKRMLYGRAQIIWRDPLTGVLSAGSDPRADGCAMPQI